MGPLEESEGDGNRIERNNTIMRLTMFIVFLCLFFFCSVAQAYYLVTPDKTFIIDDTTYSFRDTLNLTFIGKNGSQFLFDNVVMSAYPSLNETMVFIRVNSFNASMVNLTFHASRPCDVLFNVTGIVFVKYYLTGNETVQIPLWSDNATASAFNISELSELTKVDPIWETVMTFFPILIMFTFIIMLFSMLRI